MNKSLHISLCYKCQFYSCNHGYQVLLQILKKTLWLMPCTILSKLFILKEHIPIEIFWTLLHNVLMLQEFYDLRRAEEIVYSHIKGDIFRWFFSASTLKHFCS